MRDTAAAGNIGAYSAGLAHLQLPAFAEIPAFPAIVVYPSHAPHGTATVGPYTFTATLDAPVASGAFPLCVISHGGGGSHLLYRSVATHLAERGWIVVCPEHPYDNRNDRSRVGTDEAARDRPRHITHTIDSMVDDDRWAAHLDPTRVAVIGHSMGGMAALALGGGTPWSITRVPLGTTADSRVRAVVLLAPAFEWFSAPGALDGVRIPLLTMVGEHDPVTPAGRMRDTLEALPPAAPMTFEVVPGAGHFAFITPFPAQMRRPDFAPSVDPPGFDREAFHVTLPARIAHFLAEQGLSFR